MLHAVLLISVLLAPVHARAQSARIDRIHIIDPGIYSVQSRPPDPLTGIRIVSNPQLLRRTADIPAKLGLSFGFRYLIQGVPVGVKVPVEFVTLYPHPGIHREGKRLAERRYTMQIAVAVRNFASFQFDEFEELVPGIWIMEAWTAGRKLGEQRFCVLLAEALESSCRDISS